MYSRRWCIGSSSRRYFLIEYGSTCVVHDGYEVFGAFVGTVSPTERKALDSPNSFVVQTFILCFACYFILQL